MDVVFVTEERTRTKYVSQIIFSYLGVKPNEAPSRQVMGWGFEQYYTPLNPEEHAKRLHSEALVSLVLSEAIRDALKAMALTDQRQTQKPNLEQSVQSQVRSDGIPIVHHPTINLTLPR